MGVDDFGTGAHGRNLRSKRDTRLRPYLVPRARRLLPKRVQRFVGGGLVAAWPYILGFTLYAVGVAFLIDFVIEEQFPAYISVGSNFGVWGFFAIGAFLVAKAFGATGKYAEGIRVFFDVADALGTASIYVTGRVDRFGLTKTVRMARYDKHRCPGAAPDDPTMVTVTYHSLVQDIQDLLRALAFVVKHNFRTNRGTDNYENSVSSDVDLADVGVDVNRLPMDCHLIYELQRLETDSIGGILEMVLHRFNLLSKGGLINPTSANGINAHINSVGSQASRLNALSVLGFPAPYADVLLVGLVLWALFFPWELWTEFRYMGIAIYFVAISFVFGIWRLSDLITNPYDRADTSPYMYHDLGLLTRDIAANVDDVFDKFVAEALLHDREDGLSSGAPAASSSSPSSSAADRDSDRDIVDIGNESAKSRLGYDWLAEGGGSSRRRGEGGGAYTNAPDHGVNYV